MVMAGSVMVAPQLLELLVKVRTLARQPFFFALNARSSGRASKE